MEQICFTPVAYVVNSCNESTLPNLITPLESTIVVLPEYYDALFGIEKCEYLDIIFYFHKNKETKLITTTLAGDVRGVFASRAPFRPNGVGVTRVKVLRVDGNSIYVTGLDALNGSPVIDIKCGY